MLAKKLSDIFLIFYIMKLDAQLKGRHSRVYRSLRAKQLQHGRIHKNNVINMSSIDFYKSWNIFGKLCKMRDLSS
jgi:hypothetical protein